ncbi:MAG: HalD/BesD family halogenase [Rhizobiaceae bacterium]
MQKLFNLEKFPINCPESESYRLLVKRCRTDLEKEGMFNLEGFVHNAVMQKAVEAIAPKMAAESFTHARSHNVYFKEQVDGLPQDHPALTKFQTVNHTLCADQLQGNRVIDIYEWEPLIRFLAAVMNKDQLHVMEDPLARVNVMSYREGETLNWHFDRSEFTTTLLLQAPEAGGAFEYRKDLRSAENPNYDGVEKLLSGQDPQKKSMTVTPGTLNVFRGINTPHRVTKIQGNKERIIAVFSYYDRPGVMFSREEQVGFYGRAA